MQDDDGSEIPIYTQSGYRIHRHLARIHKNTPTYGILIDLQDIASLFHPTDTDDLFDEDLQHPQIQYTVYPQAGLVTAGHFQANGLITAFHPHLQQLNNSLISHQDIDDDSTDNDISDSPIIGVACQAYNAIMHTTRGRSAQHHDAQLGIITSTLAGAWATGYKNQQTARELKDRCDYHYPHNEFQSKISRDTVCTDLRLENTFVINLEDLPNDYRNGG